MNASSLFLFAILTMLLFNVVYGFTSPDYAFNMVIGGVIGFIATILAVGVISGFNVLGSGLTGASVKILFGVASLLNLMFQVDIAGFPIGLGLMSTMLNAFGTEFFGLGYIITITLAILTVSSGLIMITGGGGE